MKNNKGFRPASRRGFFTIELTLCADAARAIKWLYAHERAYHDRRSLRQLCEHVLCVYADTALTGKSYIQFRADARKHRKPDYEPMDERALLVEEIADAIEWGVYSERKHGRDTAAASQATELVEKRRAGQAIRWTKAIKPAQLYP